MEEAHSAAGKIEGRREGSGKAEDGLDGITPGSMGMSLMSLEVGDGQG